MLGSRIWPKPYGSFMGKTIVPHCKLQIVDRNPTSMRFGIRGAKGVDPFLGAA